MSIAVALLSGLGSASASAPLSFSVTDFNPTASGAASQTAVGHARTVTLITGDTVTVTPGVKGAPVSVSVQKRPGATGPVRTVSDDSGTYVFPEEAEPYIASGVLDKRLFNVTELISQGYDDQHAAGLPLIVTREAGASRLSATDLPGVAIKRQLTSVDGEAVVADRSKIASMWRALVAAPGGQVDRKAVKSPSLSGGIDRIWLDGKVEAALADSTAQIGAPQVWDEGATGAGVKVAVLDTGIDAGHPDLENRIATSRSFVPGEDVADGSGHGTHVASTIAGTGAASAGQEKGVAPGASLVIGKVLDNSGAGDQSWIIAGMEWAAKSEKAKIISMSLGLAKAHTQDDPISQSVNKLSEETGVLFVIAAGNSGNDQYTVNAPGTAESALTVGAVNSADKIAEFSSSGPRAGDDGLKPDITAPGVGILAARSQYVSGEGYYTVKSGTSMATPHVAGAAALLAEKHPDWSGQQLKSALMSTSKITPDISTYLGGTGRVDVSEAFRAQVVASGSVDTGLIKWSRDPQPIERHIAYTNHGISPVTLRLTLDRGQSPSSLFALGSDQIDVPAHDSASVSLVIDPRGVAAGGYTGQVVARDSGGAIAAHTVLSTRTESERYDLTLRAKDRDGQPMAGAVTLKGSNDVELQHYWVPETGLTLHLPRDTYSAMMYKTVRGTHGPYSQGLALLGDPEVELTDPKVVTFDASQAHQVQALTPKPSMPTNTRVEYWRAFTTTQPQYGDWIDGMVIDATYDSVWAQPSSEKVKRGAFDFTTRWRAPQTPLAVSRGTHDLDVLTQSGTKPLPNGAADLDAVFAGTGSPTDYAHLSARGKAAVVRRSSTVTAYEQTQAAQAAGVKLLLVVNDAAGRLRTWYGDDDYVSPGPVAVASVTKDDGETLIAQIAASPRKNLRLRATAHPDPSYVYDLVSHHSGGIPTDLTYRPDSRSLAQVDVTFGQNEETPVTETRSDFARYAGDSVWSFTPEPVARGPRTDWISTGTDVRWQQEVTVPNVVREVSEQMTYRSAGTYKECWVAPILRPRMISTDLPTRENGNVLSFAAPAWASGGAAHSGSGSTWGGLSQRTALYQGDTLISESDSDSGYGGNLSPKPLPYRLVVDATNDNPSFSRYSTTTHTEWAFVSGDAENKTIPLAQLDYGVDIDADGMARRIADLTVTPSVLGAPTNDVPSVRLEVSYDDGTTWHRQTLIHRDGSWKTVLLAPYSASFVSLRTNATDTRGNSVSQTIIRAYGLR
ncbi:S8 family serine peptidase [Streptomyces sp. NPDC088354]|uniref:S8 family serine peptidase n=1 Tax=Streptomyces sp. NPDC088354 TaxID=3365856 RepID=UPI0037F20A2D